MKYFIPFLFLIPSAQAFELQNIVRAAEIKYELPEGLLGAMIAVESSGDHKAFVPSDGVSQKPSYGLMQIQLGSARFVGFRGKPKDLMKPEINVEYAAAYLSWLLQQTKGDYSLALTAYNTGLYSNAVKNKKYGKYVGKVFNAWMKTK